MIIINNVQYRNLEEQVKKNMDDIQYILEGEGALNEFGIKIVGEITSSSQLPDPDTYQGGYGDAYAVGTASPYTLYIYTRANDTHPNNYWFNIGEFPLAGPQGPAGPKGADGPQGTRGSTWSSGTSAPTTSSGLADDKYLNTTNGDVYNYTGSTWQLIGNIRGPQGIQGPQGPAGGLPTNGFYYYNVIPTSKPVLGQNYTYDDTKTEYPLGVEFVSGQMVVDPNGNIYEATGSVMICRFVKNQTTGIYTYNGTPSQNPEIGMTYSFDNSLVQYPSECSFFNGQFIVDNNGNIYKCTASTMCMAVLVNGSTGGSEVWATQILGYGIQDGSTYYKFNVTLLSSQQLIARETTNMTTIYNAINGLIPNCAQFGVGFSYTSSSNTPTDTKLGATISKITSSSITFSYYSGSRDYTVTGGSGNVLALVSKKVI